MHPSNNLTGHACQVYSIQESIQSLGGLPVLFPLLEQACFKSTARNKRLATGADDSNVSAKSEGVIDDEPTTGDNDDNNQDIDMVDGSGKPILSDLPVSYSPNNNKKKQESKFKLGSSSIAGSDGDADSIRWTEEIDEELSTIEVAVNITSVNATSNSTGVSNSAAKSYVDSLDNATTATVPIPMPSPQLTSAVKPQLLSKEKKAGSFVVLGTPPIPRYGQSWNKNIITQNRGEGWVF